MPQTIQKKLIEQEMKENYIDYSMSVIMSRALPDVRDGLKPVHRRILYSMYKSKLFHNKPHRKSAYITGRVSGTLHPHGDAAIYDALVRLAQDFSLRYPLIDGHGNFGSTEFPPAHQRYTEARLSKVAQELLKDIEKNTVPFIPNYDNTTKEPTVLPSKIPNLLINGTTGIAVGMASNIPPHNIQEICDAIISTIQNPDITIEQLTKIIKGPDFPTGAIIIGTSGIKQAYKTGKALIKVRAKTQIQQTPKKRIIITEIPYQLNKTTLIESIANLVRNKTITGISDIRDESDRQGMRIVIELKKEQDPQIILNQLYKHTQLQTTFSIIMLALVNQQPKILNLKQLITHFINHRKQVITKRTEFDLKNAQEKAHILQGLKIALKNIENIITIIRSSKNTQIATKLLLDNFPLTEKQAKAILETRLQQLTTLEQEKIQKEHQELLTLIKKLKQILSSEQKILEIIKQELIEIKQKYKDNRKTQIIQTEQTINDEDLIKQEQIVITITNSNYIKQTPLSEYKKQKRGGYGTITKTKEQDSIQDILITSNLNYLLFFTNKGYAYFLKAYKLPKVSRHSKGKPIINLLQLKNEKITTILPTSSLQKQKYILFATKKGIIKKTPLKAFSKPRKTGIKAISLKNDELIKTMLTSGLSEIILASKKGLAVKFNEKDIRPMSRNAYGVIGIKLINDELIGMEPAKHDLLTITENGYGKRTSTQEYRLIKRSGKGVKNIKITQKTGLVVAIKSVKPQDEIICTSKNGHIIRIPIHNIPKLSRNTQGVRIMKLKQNDKVISIAKKRSSIQNKT